MLAGVVRDFLCCRLSDCDQDIDGVFVNMIAAARSGRNARVGGWLSHVRLMGLLICAVLPALFWTGLIAFVGVVSGHPFEVTTLVAVALAIGFFLAGVAWVLMASKALADEG